MLTEQSTPTLPSVQPAVRNNSITSFPVQATIYNAPRALFLGQRHSIHNLLVNDGDVITLTGKRGGYHFSFVTADGREGMVLARDVEVCRD